MVSAYGAPFMSNIDMDTEGDFINAIPIYAAVGPMKEVPSPGIITPDELQEAITTVSSNDETITPEKAYQAILHIMKQEREQLIEELERLEHTIKHLSSKLGVHHGLEK